MHDILIKTIDKISFKINIPILVTIVVGTATIYGSYLSILAEIKAITATITQHTSIQTQHELFVSNNLKEHDDKINDLRTRVSIIEKVNNIK